MKLISCYCLIVILLLSCTPDPDPPKDPGPPPPENPITFLALGDSYTIGQGVTEAERWPNQLADSLFREGIPILAPEVIAKTGWTTVNLRDGIEEESLGRNFHLVSLMIGVNNQFQGWSVSLYAVQFESLLQTAISHAQGDTSRVFVLSIPDYGVTPFAKNMDTDRIASDIDAFNKVAKESCDRFGVPFFDITEISRDAKNDASLLATDQLHPSEKMYTLWVQEILPEIRKMVE